MNVCGIQIMSTLNHITHAINLEEVKIKYKKLFGSKLGKVNTAINI